MISILRNTKSWNGITNLVTNIQKIWPKNIIIKNRSKVGKERFTWELNCWPWKWGVFLIKLKILFQKN